MPILYILDDDVHLTGILKVWFTRKGFTVHTFLQSDELLQAMYSTMPNCVLLDVKLANEADSIWLCQKLKTEYAYPHKIILYSVSPVSVNHLEKCGADEFIEKPFDLHYLTAVINNAISDSGLTS